MSLLSRFTSVFRDERLNREIEAEQQFHIASRIDELVEEGMTPDEAARQARLQFGSQVQAREESRDAKLFAWLESTGQDLYYGFRTLTKSRSFAAIAILTLALGIGANTAIFSVVNGVLLNPLPYRDAGQIVSLFEEIPSFKNGSISYPNFLDWQRMNRTFSAIAAYRSTGFNLSGEGEPEHLQGEMISAGFFEILGVNPVRGRTFRKEEDLRGANPTAMISEGLWRRKFASTPDIVGKRLMVDGVRRTVIGVVPSTFRLRIWNFQGGVSLNDLYIPIGEFNEPHFYGDRGAFWGMDAIGRLKPDVTLEQAREDMDRVSRQLTATYPDVDSNQKANLVPLKEGMVGNMRPILLVLLGAVAFVLLISCVNVANLLLARSTSRQREFAIRLAVGAGQLRIVRQLLTESMLLALIGGGLGLFLAKFGTAAAIAAVPRTVPRAEEIGLDLRVLLFTVLVSLAAGVVFGLAPALKTRRANIGRALKESGRTLAGTRSRTQGLFVVLEMAMALVLLVGAGLMIRTLFVLWRVDPGFHARAVMTFAVSPPSSLTKETPAAIRAFFRRVHDKLASAPGVEAVSLSWGATPMAGDNEDYFWFAGRPKPAGRNDMPMALRYVVEPDYLKTLQIALRRGRFLTDNDNEHASSVVVIDETLAEKYFSGQDPIGQYLDLNSDPSEHDKMPNPRIVGIAGHINQWGLDSDAANPLHAQMYLPAAQIPDKDMSGIARVADVYVRTKRAGVPSFETLRQRLLNLNSGLVAFDDEELDETVSRSIASKRFTMTLLAVFAGLALLLASIGIYGVLSYLVGQRTQEIGVRMALGAGRLEVLRMILTDGARMTVAGIGIGVIAALGLTQLMSSMLFGVHAADPLTFVLVAVALCLIALLACYLPARRAMKIDPMIALRDE
ncbi:MAG TPA: ABC transporter permease [Bryobacteraceae bacterium]|jgi:predicted permease|nr:ABC transporter permease [Bryobacteraceae bacterium]